MANSSMSNVPKVSEYMVANERSVKHQPICVDAKATLPRSGDRRYDSSGSIALTCKLRTLQITEREENSRNNRVDFLDSVLDLEESFTRR